MDLPLPTTNIRFPSVKYLLSNGIIVRYRTEQNCYQSDALVFDGFRANSINYTDWTKKNGVSGWWSLWFVHPIFNFFCLASSDTHGCRFEWRKIVRFKVCGAGQRDCFFSFRCAHISIVITIFILWMEIEKLWVIFLDSIALVGCLFLIMLSSSLWKSKRDEGWEFPPESI